MEETKEHFQHIMLYYFKKGKNATERKKKKKEIYAVYGEGAVIDQRCQKGLVKFVIEISHWMILHNQVDQLKLIARH